MCPAGFIAGRASMAPAPRCASGVGSEIVIGEILDGRYQIRRLLGRGGMGAVYEARHTGTARTVAVKLIEGGSDDPAGVARFEREARVAGSIETQHIVQVLDSGTDPATGAPYMVMEYLDGEDLEHLLDRVRVLPSDVVLRIAAQVGRGLSRAHAAGVVHRDIKPANLFLTRRDDGEIVVKILDFGIAKIQRGLAGDIATGNLTETGSMLGSPRYLAPEQARASKTMDARADLWALGVVLYRALSGHTPHETAPSLVELIMRICSDPPSPVQDLAPWVAPEVAAILDRMLRIPRDERFPSAEAMLDALRPLLPDGTQLRAEMLVPLDVTARARVAPRFVATLGGVEGPPSVDGSMSVTARSSAGTPVEGPASVATVRRGQLRVAALALGACLAGIAGTFAFVAGRSPPTAEPRAPAAVAPSVAPAPVPPEPAAPRVAVATSAPLASAGPAPSAPHPAARLPPRPAARPASNGFDPSSPF